MGCRCVSTSWKPFSRKTSTAFALWQACRRGQGGASTGLTGWKCNILYPCTRVLELLAIYVYTHIYIYTENPSCKCPVAISCWNLSANAGTSKAKPDGPSSLCELGPRPPPTLCCCCICPTCPKGADILRHVIYTCGMPRAVRVHFVSSDPGLLLPTLCCTASSGKIR